MEPFVKQLAGIGTLEVGPDAKKPAQKASALRADFEAYVSLAGLIDVAKEIERRLGKETRTVVLGHLQRGGAPTTFDRVLATQFGAHAVRLVVERKFGHMVTYQPPDMLDVPILDAIKLATVCPNCSAVQAARALGICFGDDQHEPPDDNWRNLVHWCRDRGERLSERMEFVFTMLQMNDFRDLLGAKMSTGMRQKVSIARATVHDPPILIFDEPTLGLDVMVARTVLENIERLRELGKCIVYSTHIMREVEKICDRVAIISRGKIRVSGTLPELRDQYGQDDLEELFFALVS